MPVTPNVGYNTIPTNSPDYHEGNGTLALLSANFTKMDLKSGVEVETANGAIGIKEGTSFITKAGVAAMTLASPVAGLPAVGGDDGKQLKIVSTTAFAHTVTTPNNGLNGTLHIATFAANVASMLYLVAYNGSWYQLPSTGITLS